MTFRFRLFIATALALLEFFLINWGHTYSLATHMDFGPVWFAARCIAHGIDPYPLVGPHRAFDFQWGLNYPATSFVAVLPLSIFSEQMATAIFVAVSTFLLALGVTQRGWYLLPLFVSEPFANAAQLGQWSILFTAALFFPWLLLFAGVKPQTTLPVLAYHRSLNTIRVALVGSATLVLISLVLLPGWPREWFQIIRATHQFKPPLLEPGGFLILFALLRWRQRESWLLLGLAALPQTLGWYTVLPLFTIPKNFQQSLAYTLCVTLGAWPGYYLIHAKSLVELHSQFAGIQIVSAYLPALVLILMRPNLSATQSRKPATVLADGRLDNVSREEPRLD